MRHFLSSSLSSSPIVHGPSSIIFHTITVTAIIAIIVIVIVVFVVMVSVVLIHKRIRHAPTQFAVLRFGAIEGVLVAEVMCLFRAMSHISQ